MGLSCWDASVSEFVPNMSYILFDGTTLRIGFLYTNPFNQPPHMATDRWFFIQILGMIWTFLNPNCWPNLYLAACQQWWLPNFWSNTTHVAVQILIKIDGVYQLYHIYSHILVKKTKWWTNHQPGIFGCHMMSRPSSIRVTLGVAPGRSSGSWRWWTVARCRARPRRDVWTSRSCSSSRLRDLKRWRNTSLGHLKPWIFRDFQGLIWGFFEDL